jgi:hypothetical protein
MLTHTLLVALVYRCYCCYSYCTVLLLTTSMQEVGWIDADQSAELSGRTAAAAAAKQAKQAAWSAAHPNAGKHHASSAAGSSSGSAQQQQQQQRTQGRSGVQVHRSILLLALLLSISSWFLQGLLLELSMLVLQQPIVATVTVVIAMIGKSECASQASSSATLGSITALLVNSTNLHTLYAY